MLKRIATLILLLSTLVPCSASQPPGLSRQESKAYRTIAATDSLFIDVGYDSPVNIAFRKLLKSRKADAVFKRLLSDGSTVGKLYALCGIYYTDRSFFHRAVAPFRHSADVIRIFSDCTGDWTEVGSIVESEEKLWGGDIISGGLPNQFKYPCGEPAFALVLTTLSVENSDIRTLERPVESVPDTIQFWFTPRSRWRIRTCAEDHDVYIYTLGARPRKDRTNFFGIYEATEYIAKNYSKVAASTVVLRFYNPNDREDVQRVLADHKLPGKLEIQKNGLAFYNPGDGEYRTKPQ